MKEYVDMLLEGSHRKTTDELHAFTKASRKRLREGRKIEARRKLAAAKKTCKIKPFIEAL
jgi:hypothetical protein